MVKRIGYTYKTEVDFWHLCRPFWGHKLSSNTLIFFFRKLWLNVYQSNLWLVDHELTIIWKSNSLESMNFNLKVTITILPGLKQVLAKNRYNISMNSDKSKYNSSIRLFNLYQPKVITAGNKRTCDVI